MKKRALLKQDFDQILERWEEALQMPENDLHRDAAILRFELSFEVLWKLLQIILIEEGLEVNSPRQAFRKSFNVGIISEKDEELWFEILQARNTAIHVYRQSYAEQLRKKLPEFYQAFKRVKEKIDQYDF